MFSSINSIYSLIQLFGLERQSVQSMAKMLQSLGGLKSWRQGTCEKIYLEKNTH